MSNSHYKIKLQSGFVYHICNQGNNRENIFKEVRNYAYFLEKYKKTIHPLVDTFSYCLLPNHFHLLVRIKPYSELHKAFPRHFPLPTTEMDTAYDISSPEDVMFDEEISRLLSRKFGGWFNGYAQAINKTYRRKGKLLSLPFKRYLVEDENYFSYLITYIHRNPIHHFFSTNYETWTFSSYVEILNYLIKNGLDKTDSKIISRKLLNNHSQLPKDIINLPFLLEWFGTPQDYIKEHEISLDFLDADMFLEYD